MKAGRTTFNTSSILNNCSITIIIEVDCHNKNWGRVYTLPQTCNSLKIPEYTEFEIEINYLLKRRNKREGHQLQRPAIVAMAGTNKARTRKVSIKTPILIAAPIWKTT